jgi:hypothetical protein
MNAYPTRHLGIVYRGTDHGPEACTLEDDPEDSADQERHGNDEEAVDRKKQGANLV